MDALEAEPTPHVPHPTAKTPPNTTSPSADTLSIEEEATPPLQHSEANHTPKAPLENAIDSHTPSINADLGMQSNASKTEKAQLTEEGEVLKTDNEITSQALVQSLLGPVDKKESISITAEQETISGSVPVVRDLVSCDDEQKGQQMNSAVGHEQTSVPAEKNLSTGNTLNSHDEAKHSSKEQELSHRQTVHSDVPSPAPKTTTPETAETVPTSAAATTAATTAATKDDSPIDTEKKLSPSMTASHAQAVPSRQEAVATQEAPKETQPFGSSSSAIQPPAPPVPVRASSRSTYPNYPSYGSSGMRMSVSAILTASGRNGPYQSTSYMPPSSTKVPPTSTAPFAKPPVASTKTPADDTKSIYNGTPNVKTTLTNEQIVRALKSLPAGINTQHMNKERPPVTMSTAPTSNVGTQDAHNQIVKLPVGPTTQTMANTAPPAVAVKQENETSVSTSEIIESALAAAARNPSTAAAITNLAAITANITNLLQSGAVRPPDDSQSARRSSASTKPQSNTSGYGALRFSVHPGGQPAAQAAGDHVTSRTKGKARSLQEMTPLSLGATGQLPQATKRTEENVRSKTSDHATHSVEKPKMPERVPKLIVNNEKVFTAVSHLPARFLGTFVYTPDLLLPRLDEHLNALIEVRIPARFLTYENPKIKQRSVWGTDVYTDDSDVVTMIVHSGKYDMAFEIPELPENDPFFVAVGGVPEQSNQQKTGILGKRRTTTRPSPPDHDLKVTLRVLPQLKQYQGRIRHYIRSRNWGSNHDGVSLYVERLERIERGAARSHGRSTLKRNLLQYEHDRAQTLGPRPKQLRFAAQDEDDKPFPETRRVTFAPATPTDTNRIPASDSNTHTPPPLYSFPTTEASHPTSSHAMPSESSTDLKQSFAGGRRRRTKRTKRVR